MTQAKPLFQLSFGEKESECALLRQFGGIAWLSPLQRLDYIRVRQISYLALNFLCLSIQGCLRGHCYRGQGPGLVRQHQRNEALSKEMTTGGPPDGSPGREWGPKSLPEIQGSIGEEGTM